MTKKVKRKKLGDQRAPVEIPANFEFDKVFNTQGLNKTKRENIKNGCYYILHLLTRHIKSRYYFVKLQDKSYYTLNAELLKKICGDEYVFIIETLKTNKVIEVKEDYIPGVKSREYRLTEKYNIGASQFKELDGTIRNRFLKVQELQEEKNHQNLKKLSHLTKWFDNTRLTVDIRGAHNFIELAFMRINKLIAKSDNLTPDEKTDARARATLKLNHQIQTIRSLIKGDYGFKNMGKDERLHNVLTQIKRELRSFIQYDEKDLVSLDIRSSQPYLFTILLHKGFYSKSKKDNTGWKSITDDILITNTIHTSLPNIPLSTLHTIMFPGLHKQTEHQVLAKSKFFNFPWSTDFYLHYATLVTEETTKPKTRQSAKSEIMWLFFEFRPYKFISPVYNSFQKTFPLEAQVIRGFNNVQVKLLPIVLQRLESRILLHNITKNISETFPDAPIFTIHDSILTTEEYVEKVHTIMEEKLHEIVGAKPGITIEYKTPKKELDNLTSFSEMVFQDTVTDVLKSTLKFKPADREKPLLRRSPGHNGFNYFGPYYYATNNEAFPDSTEVEEYDPSYEDIRVYMEEESRKFEEYCVKHPDQDPELAFFLYRHYY